jgi:hypothetical protein
MSDELWIVSDAESCGWLIDSKGKVTADDEYSLEGERVSIGVPDGPLTQKQADAIRGLIADLRKNGTLERGPAVGVQYPQRTTVENVKQAMLYIHAWPDDCDEELHTSADAGLCTDVPWVDGVAVEPPDQSIHQDTPVLVRARNEKGHFISDDPDTPENEAWVEVDGVPQPIEEKPAAGESQEPQGGETDLEGEFALAPGHDVPGQVTVMSGDKGPEVESWQAICNEILLSNDSMEQGFIPVDGSFGEQTEELTRVIQAELGVPVTGACDQATWDAVVNG